MQFECHHRHRHSHHPHHHDGTPHYGGCPGGPFCVPWILCCPNLKTPITSVHLILQALPTCVLIANWPVLDVLHAFELDKGI